MLEASSGAATDEYLIFLSGFPERSAMRGKRIAGRLPIASITWRRRAGPGCSRICGLRSGRRV